MYDYYFYNLISKKVYKEIFLITPIIKTPKLNTKKYPIQKELVNSNRINHKKCVQVKLTICNERKELYY